MTFDNSEPALGDLLEAYAQLDETGRRVFSCALLHILAAYAGRNCGASAGRGGGHWRDWDREVLSLPRAISFGRGLEVPVEGIFGPRNVIPAGYRRIY